MKVLPDYCQAETQESPKGGQERGKEYLKACRKKGCSKNSVAPHTLPGMLELPLQQSFKGTQGSIYPLTLKTSSYSLYRSSQVVFRPPWTLLMIFSKILQQKFQPGLIISRPTVRQIFLISSDLSLQVFLSYHKGSESPKPRESWESMWARLGQVPPALVTATSGASGSGCRKEHS